MGADAFHDLITDYLVVHPPTCFSLRFAGEHLPVFLASDPDASACRAAFPWSADLAALEWALVEVFDAPDAPVLAREALAKVPPEAWGGLRFALTPALRTLDLAWPAQRIRKAYDAGKGAVPLIHRARARLLVWRREERVFYRAMAPLEEAGLAIVRVGETFGTLCKRVAVEVGEAKTPLRTLALLERWISDGLLTGLND